MFDQNTWEFINTFAPWLSAIGTIAAVITSLYLAKRGDALKLKIQARVMLLIAEGQEGQPEYLNVTIINIRRREATITALGWETGLFKKNYFYWMIPRNRLSAAIPVTLKDGQRAEYMMPMSDFDRLLGDIGRKFISGRLSFIKAHFIRISATASTGDNFKSRVNKSLRDRFFKLAREAKEEIDE